MRKQNFFSTTHIFSLLVVLPVALGLPWQGIAGDSPNSTSSIHVVSPGESLNSIARQYLPLTEPLTVTHLVEMIRDKNNIQGSLIRPDQRLVIPVVRSTPVTAKTVPKQSDFRARGIYVNRYSMGTKKMQRLLSELIAVGGNTAILDAKDMSGRLFYPSRVRLAQEIGASANPIMPDPSKLFHCLHEKGLHVGVRLVAFYDPLLAAKMPELALRSTSGDPVLERGKAAWVDPSNSTVQRYNLDIARELAEMGVDEIQFDYIRFPTTENVRMAATCRDEEETPRHNIITEFLAQAKKELDPYRVLLSVDVFGIMAWMQPKDLHMTGQKIEDLAQHCDVICPMIYPSHFYGRFQGIANPADHPDILVSEACRRFSNQLQGCEVTLRPWIQAFPFGTSNYNEGYILEELDALYESKARGWLLWSAGNEYDVAWKALAQWNSMAWKRRPIMAVLRIGIGG